MACLINADNHRVATVDLPFPKTPIATRLQHFVRRPMTTMRLVGEFNQPEMQCDDCDVRFTLYWQRDGIHDKVEYCPFCGEEVEEVVDELE